MNKNLMIAHIIQLLGRGKMMLLKDHQYKNVYLLECKDVCVVFSPLAKWEAFAIKK